FKDEIINKAVKKDSCIDCGKKLQEDFNYCPYCGYKVVL
ncbi:MAG: zinc-ribbon domain-containing protein, partial [Actinobacteria bacterium]|nr:zinc-ribbon domain-containing protein [Actinomycetota bacterium]